MAHPHPHCPLWHVGLDGATAGALFDPLLLLLLLLLLFLVVVLAVVLNLLLLPLLLLLLNLDLNHHQHHQHLVLHVYRLDFHQPCRGVGLGGSQFSFRFPRQASGCAVRR